MPVLKPVAPPPVVAAATGLLVGLAMVGLVALGFLACDALRGTPSCGGPGLLMLIAAVVGAVLAGRFLLAYGDVPDPGIVSFLAVTTLAVVVLAFLIDLAFSPWMWLVLPLLAGAAFPAAAYVVARSGGAGGARR